VGALDPAYTRVLVSLAFQGECSRSCTWGQREALSSCVYPEAGLATQQAPSNGAWSHTETSGQEIGSVELQVIVFILPWLVTSLFVDSERALFLAGYGTRWVHFGLPGSMFS
jgi:hypothetical protein